jgi:NAD(P)H-nitrite reductase large subunit
MSSENIEIISSEFSDILDLKEKNLLDDEVLICECFCVNARDIRNTFDDKAMIDVEILKKNFGFGEGCRSCLKNKDIWIDKIF